MSAMATAVFLLTIIYLLILSVPWMAFLWRAGSSTAVSSSLKTAIIIAARNEEKNISLLLDALKRQSMLPDEVIVCDDNSEDETVTRVKGSIEHYPVNLKCVKSVGKGKKMALTTGIRASAAEIIIVTDADCEVPVDWVKSHRNAYQDGTMFVGGMIKNSVRPALLRNVLATETVFLQVVSAGMFLLKKPLMCNGANMSFRKSFFEQCGGFRDDEYVSGDDLYLLNKAAERGIDAVGWLTDYNSVVTTPAAATIRESVNQRTRWLSKMAAYSNGFTWLISLTFFAVQILVPIGLISAFVYGIHNAFFISFCAKSATELLLLSLAVPFFRESRLIPAFLFSVLLYPVISVCAGLNLLSGKQEWKGRILRNGKLK